MTARSNTGPFARLPRERDVTVAIIGLFTSLAVCALIGWGFIRLLGVAAGRVGRNRSASDQPRVGSPLMFRSGAFTSQEEQPEVARDEAAETEPDPGPEPKPETRRNIETYFDKGRWKNKVQGSSRAAHVHATRADALQVGRDMARKRRVEHVIRNKDGSIGEQDTERADPRSEAG
jgi:hypothetical protein